MPHHRRLLAILGGGALCCRAAAASLNGGPLASEPSQSRSDETRRMSQDVLSQLAPTGVLRAGINLGNFLLVTGRGPSGDPEGVSPDMA